MSSHWYFDFVSPFAYLQLPSILALRERLAVTPVPILFGAVLRHHGQLGPAEIPGKRDFTYRMVQWQAERAGRTLRFPPTHPFNPVAALRLCISAGADWTSIVTIFDHLWCDGRAGDDAAALAEPAARLGIADVAAAIGTDAVKAALRANTEAAIGAGVFGVPTLAVGEQRFWGNDATPMLLDWLDDPQRFEHGEYARLSALPVGIERRR
ncbi:MAG: 2-hydroxychromene-2-carboxylate isomerase [Rhodanobacter denitrificans]|uniref:2-hydroxychromene-2-carboxylate isomerase n=1 Tax=Rhodanobacter denitrificans TaxID=666685 RepID=A0A2W5K529_9GAMM|nr:MAG: 2-hydroxychromene-2-carboxylate isomerase [Rhodanobacter denitrificans]